MILDFHTHIFPNAIAQKTLQILSAKGNIPYYCDATKDATEKDMEGWGIDKFVTLPIATKPEQMATINKFAVACKSDKIIPFGSVHPYAESVVKELEQIKALGLKGIKLHPEYQYFKADCLQAMKVYEKCQTLDLIVVLHAGKDIGFPNSLMASPKSLRAISLEFSDLNFVFAHMGGFGLADQVLDELIDVNAFFDTAFCFNKMDIEKAKQIIKAKGINKILFGSDCPWECPLSSIEFVKNLGLTKEQEQMIFWENAQNLLNL